MKSIERLSSLPRSAKHPRRQKRLYAAAKDANRGFVRGVWRQVKRCRRRIPQIISSTLPSAITCTESFRFAGAPLGIGAIVIKSAGSGATPTTRWKPSPSFGCFSLPARLPPDCHQTPTIVLFWILPPRARQPEATSNRYAVSRQPAPACCSQGTMAAEKRM